MKKAKIMLTAIAVFAVVGGALAFKAKRLVTVYTQSTNGQCSVPLPNRSISTVGLATFASATPTTLPCPATRITVVP
jgi:hypothetical protein